MNADHDYVHRNKSIKGFGSYGDILIRDRKMYVAPTPFGLLSGVAHLQTLILPENIPMTGNFQQVGTIVRQEADRLIIGYEFNLRDNQLTTTTIANPSAGKEHSFRAWRLRIDPAEPVALRAIATAAEDEIMSSIGDEE